MTTIIINERTKAGKTLLELARILALNNKGVSIDSNTTSLVKIAKVALSPKQKNWIIKLKTVKSEVESGIFKGQSAQSFLDEL